MFSTQKRIFAGKHNLHTEPFCPFTSNVSGFASLRDSLQSSMRPESAFKSRPIRRDGKRYV